jgi:hypothetical protein
MSEQSTYLISWYGLKWSGSKGSEQVIIRRPPFLVSKPEAYNLNDIVRSLILVWRYRIALRIIFLFFLWIKKWLQPPTFSNHQDIPTNFPSVRKQWINPKVFKRGHLIGGHVRPFCRVIYMKNYL